MTTYPSYVKPNVIQIFSKVAAAASDVLKSGTFNASKYQKAVLWIKTSAQAGGTVTSSGQLYDVAPAAADTAQDATGPTDKVAHGSAITTSGNQLKRNELGAGEPHVLGTQYLEITMGGTGTITVEAWLELYN